MEILGGNHNGKKDCNYYRRIKWYWKRSCSYVDWMFSQYCTSKIVQYLKGRFSRLIQDEFPELKKRYWGQHLWARGYFCATVGSVTEETIKKYIENQELGSQEDIFKIDQ